ncbi:hypothetical protein OfM1_21390 [Lactovum odontotermitis]
MKIRTKQEMKQILQSEAANFFGESTDKLSLKEKIFGIYHLRFPYQTWKFIRLMIFCNYYENVKSESLKNKLLYKLYMRKYLNQSIKLGIDIGNPQVYEKGLHIHHPQGISINYAAKLGKNLQLYGNNCIGVDGKNEKCPKIGNNVILGVGAKVIGNITLADNIKVGAGAVVVHSFTEEGITLIGIPANKKRISSESEK